MGNAGGVKSNTGTMSRHFLKHRGHGGGACVQITQRGTLEPTHPTIKTDNV